MLDLNAIDVRSLDTEGLAAVMLLMLRDRIDGTGTTIGHPSAWPCIAEFYLAPRWFGYRVDMRSGMVTTPTETLQRMGSTPPELYRRAVTAMEFLRQHGLAQQDPRQTNSQDFAVPTQAGWNTRVDTDPPALGLARDAAWVRGRYGAGALHMTGTLASGDEAGGTVFWLEGGRFVTCAHNLELQGWSIHHPELRLTEEHLAPARHENPDCDLAVLTPKTPVVGRLNMVPLKLSERETPDGEPGFTMGYPPVPQRQPVLMVAGITVVATQDYRGALQSLTFTGAVSPGYSGGPALDSRGYVIGVNAECTFDNSGQGMPGFGHAVPICYLKDLLG